MSDNQSQDVRPVVERIRQSSPVNTTAPYDTRTLCGKNILITGGASGFGAAFARHWASFGANITIGDIDHAGGAKLVAELRAVKGSSGHHHYQHCDVTSWPSQVELFQTAARLSPTGGIDAVVANAGIAERDNAATGRGFENPIGLDLDTDANPPAPDLKVMTVNVTGVLYTAHLALYWLPRNGTGGKRNSQPHLPDRNGTASSPTAPATDSGGHQHPDRHLLFIGSVASLLALPGQPLYCASKHAVAGLFRSLRGTAWRHGVRTNMLCPYFVDTPLMPTTGPLILAGGAMADVADVVDAGTRFMADEAICGRALVVGPKMTAASGPADGEIDGVAGEEDLEQPISGSAMGRATTKAVWECYAHDYDNVEIFTRRYIGLLNAVERIKGWVGFVRDVVCVLFFRRRTWDRKAR